MPHSASMVASGIVSMSLHPRSGASSWICCSTRAGSVRPSAVHVSSVSAVIPASQRGASIPKTCVWAVSPQVPSCCADGDWRTRATGLTLGAMPSAFGQSISRRVSSSTMASRRTSALRCANWSRSTFTPRAAASAPLAAAPWACAQIEKSKGIVRSTSSAGRPCVRRAGNGTRVDARSTSRIRSACMASRTVSSPSRNIGFVRAQKTSMQEVALAHG